MYPYTMFNAPIGNFEGNFEPFVGDPIVGWRAWHIYDLDDMLLRSINAKTYWPARKRLEAQCVPMRNQNFAKVVRHEAPAAHGVHTCGIYACKTRDQVGQWRPMGGAEDFGLARVVGEVMLWGKVVKHVKGYRGQYAFPKSLTVTMLYPPLEENWDMLESMLERLTENYCLESGYNDKWEA